MTGQEEVTACSLNTMRGGRMRSINGHTGRTDRPAVLRIGVTRNEP